MIHRRLLTTLALVVLPAHAASQTIAFTGATVWDGTGSAPVADATILVRDGRVMEVGRGQPPEGTTVVDLDGRFVIPGLVNAHGHVSGRWATDEGTVSDRLSDELRLYALYGVTTLNSLGGAPDEVRALRDSQNGRLDRARVYFAGPVVSASTPGEAERAVASNAAREPDWIKIRVDDNLGTTEKMPWDAVEAVIDAAHGRGLRVATHLFYLDDAKRLLRAGSDLIAHSVRDLPVDEELIALLRDSDTCYVPTLMREISTFVYGDRPDFFDDPFFSAHANAAEVERLSDPASMEVVRESPSAARYRRALAQAQDNLRTLTASGTRVAMGTDSGPAGRFPGYFEHRELVLMAEAGLTPEQVLRSATSVAAACLGLDDVGTLEPGKWADFLVLREDPLLDVRHTTTLEQVYVAGTPVG